MIFIIKINICNQRKRVKFKDLAIGEHFYYETIKNFFIKIKCSNERDICVSVSNGELFSIAGDVYINPVNVSYSATFIEE